LGNKQFTAKFIPVDIDNDQIIITTDGSDGANNNHNELVVSARKYLFNETSWDRMRGNTEIEILASGARNSSAVSPNFTNYNHRGIIIWLNITDITPGGTDTVSLYVRGVDPVSGSMKNLLVGPTINSTGLQVYLIYPGVTDSESAFGDIEEIPLPRTWSVRIDHSGDTDTFTYSVGGSLIV